ncbi:hypothetical protein CPB83DRAFT_895491 [Crepidotus variabilis]|uniref:Uncharacterized protein n=1 Tax=Crepidotus variabilis TaxID=179855 RepID=A0A9P6EDI5_9AGAR|nr:hypothetical protein CPB83DRAFT_895491 [Crepidotus variabilis]
MLTTSCSPPPAKDWSMQGMERVGCKVLERGYWKSGEDKRAEIKVLNQGEGADENGGIVEEDGTIEDNDNDNGDGGYYEGQHANKSNGRKGGLSQEASGSSEMVRLKRLLSHFSRTIFEQLLLLPKCIANAPKSLNMIAVYSVLYCL